jgi:hypothetical protein
MFGYTSTVSIDFRKTFVTGNRYIKHLAFIYIICVEYIYIDEVIHEIKL